MASAHSFASLSLVQLHSWDLEAVVILGVVIHAWDLFIGLAPQTGSEKLMCCIAGTAAA